MSNAYSPSAPPSNWQRFTAGSVRVFHDYASWLVSISWKRFFVLSVLLLMCAGILSGVLPGGWTETVREDVSTPPRTPAVPKPPKNPSIRIEKGGKGLGNDDVTISIDKNGVRIGPRVRTEGSAASAASAAAPAASEAAHAEPTASAPFVAITSKDGGVEIKLPPGATSDAVKEAVEEARAAVIEAIEDARQAETDAAEAGRGAQRQVTRIHHDGIGESLPQLAFFFIVISAILKITYKGRMQAEVKAAVATETAESEQLKRQVVEARMAAMQAQVEPHFLFNTLASIDHLIETDPPRASQMQKNLIALLRASMPTMRENHPTAHNLGREIAVIRPYLEILKVRMEERLQTVVDVPDGLLSADFPSMMIQSLVENAIKHGLEPKPEGGQLSVRAEVQHGKLAVTVADTGVGFGKAATAGTGVGLNNIRERLQLLYGNKASMTVAENTPSGTVVTLTVPYLAQARDGENA
jgi:hypothetical protein